MDQLPSLRVSTKDRDAAVERLQAAYLNDRLSDTELGERIERALAAKVGGDLDALLADLPAEVAPLGSWGDGAPAPSPVKSMNTYKGSAVQGGNWTVPAQFKSQGYKAQQTIDLTKAVLSGPRTEILVGVYKSAVVVVVPRGMAVEMQGSSYAGSWVDETNGGTPGGPLLVVRGSGYKSTITVKYAEGRLKLT